MSHSHVVGGDNAALEKYFDLLERTILEADLSERPCQIFNLDESGFPLCPKPPKVITKKGEKHPACVTGEDRSQITVLACVSAGGYALPPLVIFDRKTLKPEMTQGEVPGTMYGLSNNGWIDSDTAPATGNVKMKRVCFRSKRVCFSSANVGVVFSLCLETRRKSPLVPCSVYSWIIHGILKAFPFMIFHTLRLRRKRYSSVRPGTAY